MSSESWLSPTILWQTVGTHELLNFYVICVTASPITWKRKHLCHYSVASLHEALLLGL